MRKFALALAAATAVTFAVTPVAAAEPHLPAFCEGPSKHSGADFNPVCGKVDTGNGGCSDSDKFCWKYTAPETPDPEAPAI